MKRLPIQPKLQAGITTIEFAFIAIWLMTLIIVLMEVGRVMVIRNAAAEATRLGARRAAVCDMTSSAERTKIETAMKAVLGMNNTGTITATISTSPSGCNNTTTQCQFVTATLSGTVPTFIPFVTFSPPLPTLSTTLSRESMSSTNNGAVCKSTV